MSSYFTWPTLLSPPYIGLIIDGLLTTFQLALSLFFFGGILGLLLATIRTIPFKPIDWAVALFVAYHRNVPLVVQLSFWYFGIPQLLPPRLEQQINENSSEFVFAVVALSLAYGAYVSEDIRSGIRSVSRGQYDAARAAGLGFIETMALIVLPQALRSALPALANQSLLFFKSTSLAATIGLAELTYAAVRLNDETFLTYQAFAIITAIYLFISLNIIHLLRIIDRRGDRGDR